MRMELPRDQTKENLRGHFLSVRKQIGSLRKEEAKREIFLVLADRLSAYCSVLSYAPLISEVDVSLINDELASKGILALPRIEYHDMGMYLVKNYQEGLKKGKKGFFEPIPEMNEKIVTCDVALVPAVAFDSSKHRIGFGFGHYDRFFQKHPEIYKIGIAFREQLFSGKFQTNQHDIAMNEICIV